MVREVREEKRVRERESECKRGIGRQYENLRESAREKQNR